MSRCVSSTQSARREIGTQTSVANARAPGRSANRPIGVVARLPQPAALLGLGRPDERAAAMIGGDLAEAARLFGDALGVPWNSTNSIGYSGSDESGIGVARLDLQRVEQLDAGDRQARLDRRDRRLAGGAHVGNEQWPPAIASGMPASRSVISTITPSVPFGADEQPGQVVAGGRFLRAAGGAQERAVGGDDAERQHMSFIVP